MFMVMLVLNDLNKTEEILDAWETSGAPGVTILPSTGLGRVRTRFGLLDDLPLLPKLEDFFQEQESLHRTFLAVVSERLVVDRLIQVTQSILGSLSQPNTGILVVLPVIEAYGICSQQP